MQAEPAGNVSRLFRDSLELPCSWCGAEVPLAPGDFSGVCISCGTVMFRPVERLARGAVLAERRDVRGRGESWIPAPAV